MPQFFKGDAEELKYYNSAQPVSDLLSGHKTEFYQGAYGAYPLGELIYDNGLSPLANAIPRTIFRETFESVFEAFLTAGSFESYLSVFRKIFGDDVVVAFTVPAPGELEIDIEAAGIQLAPFIARRVEGNTYVFDQIVDHLGARIVFKTIKGFESQYELEQMLFEMVPDGIYTEITLELGA